MSDIQTFFNSIGKNDISGLKELLKRGIDINLMDKYGYSALHKASSMGFEEAGLLLLDSGIDVNATDRNGQNILHYAAVYGQINLAKSAIIHGASLVTEDIHGNQPLWTAVFNDKGRNDRIEIIKLFIENGADINHKNKAGKSPYDIVTIAKYNNLKPIMRI